MDPVQFLPAIGSAVFLIVLFGFIGWLCWVSFRDGPKEPDDWY